MKHWTHFLSEAGTIYSRHGREQEIALLSIKSKEAELKRLVQNYDQEEKSITNLALKDWTQTEVDQARADSIAQFISTH